MRCKPTGPLDAPYLVVGEAPGKDEDVCGVPFIGPAGQELRRELSAAGIDPNKEVRYTNVFMDRPADNDVKAFCAKRADVGKDYPLPALSQGAYVRREFFPELDRLRREIGDGQHALVLPVGNTACWAILGRTGISRLRGSVFPSTLSDGVFCLPTFHPSAVLRDWSLRTIAITDYIKAARYVREGFSVPKRELWLDPTLAELYEFQKRYLAQCRLLSFDIETFAETITCIGFSPRPDVALTIPFFDPRQRDRNFWRTAEDERAAWIFCKELLESDIPKLGQNGLYDIQYLHKCGIRVRNYAQDTMIRHHALYPELEKGLGFLGSIYTDEAPWKLLRARNKDNFKSDDE